MKKQPFDKADVRKGTFLAEVAELWPMAKGSLAEVHKPCIRPTCPACIRGDKHPAYIYSYMAGGRRRCMHVPRELVPRLRQAIQNGRRMEERLVQKGCEMVREYRRERDMRDRRKGAA
jgi:hypothetical protein